MEPAAHEAMSGGAEDPRPARRDEDAPDQGGQIQRGRLSQEDSGELQQGKAVRSTSCPGAGVHVSTRL